MNIIDKYNPVEGKFERVPADWELRYNVTTGKYQYAPRDAVLNYGIPQESHTLRAAGNRPRFNVVENRYEQAGEDWVLEYNAVEGEYSYVPPRKRGQ